MSRSIERRPWPEDPRYLVGEDGSIIGPRGHALRPWTIDTGYLQVHTCTGSVRRARTVHIMVCEAFHGPRPGGMEVAHGNGVKTDCRAENLSWKTRPNNHADKLDHGTAQRGETANNRKLTELQVREIRQQAAAGRSCYALARELGMSLQQVSRIVRREAWKHVA